MKRTLLLTASAAALVLAGCQTTNQQLGAITGGGLGALIGSQFGKGTGRTLAIIGGGVAGAWIGSEIGSYLDQQAQNELANATYDAATTGKSSDWKSPNGSASGHVEVLEASTSSQTDEFKVLKDRVETVPPIDLIGAAYRPSGKINVRSGPGTNYKVTGSLAAGEVVTVIGKVQGKSWYMIGQNGVATGYVGSGLLNRVPTGQADQAVAASPTPSGEVETINAEVQSTCKVIKQTVTLADGTKKEQTSKLCQTPEGWKVS